MSDITGIPIISHAREGNRLGARRWSLVVSWVRLLKDFHKAPAQYEFTSDWVIHLI